MSVINIGADQVWAYFQKKKASLLENLVQIAENPDRDVAVFLSAVVESGKEYPDIIVNISCEDFYEETCLDEDDCYDTVTQIYKKYISDIGKKEEETPINKKETNDKDGKNISQKENNDIKKSINMTKYDENLYYYNPFPNLNNPILFIAIISFHHKKGSIIEFTYPSKEELLKNNENLSYLIDNSGKTKENLINELFFQLTCVYLPDGIHASNRDTQFFIIQDYKYPLYGISCY